MRCRELPTSIQVIPTLVYGWMCGNVHGTCCLTKTDYQCCIDLSYLTWDRIRRMITFDAFNARRRLLIIVIQNHTVRRQESKTRLKRGKSKLHWICWCTGWGAASLAYLLLDAVIMLTVMLRKEWSLKYVQGSRDQPALLCQILKYATSMLNVGH